MTREQKDLLIKDLCARLPYGIKVEIKYYDDIWELLAIYTNGTTYAARDIGYPIETCFEDCKPYLFPMSSMTEEQEEEYNSLNCWELGCFPHTEDALDYLIANHFDYRGLIPMGLALDATGKNIY